MKEVRKNNNTGDLSVYRCEIWRKFGSHAFSQKNSRELQEKFVDFGNTTLPSRNGQWHWWFLIANCCANSRIFFPPDLFRHSIKTLSFGWRQQRIWSAWEESYNHTAADNKMALKIQIDLKKTSMAPVCKCAQLYQKETRGKTRLFQW